MAYQQSPYQTTVVQPVVPVVVPVTRFHRFNDAHVKLAGHAVHLGTFTCIGYFGVFLCIASIMMIVFTHFHMQSVAKFDRFNVWSNTDIDRGIPPTKIIGIVLGVIGGSTVYVPVQSNVLPETPYPHQDSGISYHNATSPVSNSAQMRPEHQPFLKGIDAVPGEAAYPGPTSYSVSENGFTPEYDQQPAYAPPKYSP